MVFPFLLNWSSVLLWSFGMALQPMSCAMVSIGINKWAAVASTRSVVIASRPGSLFLRPNNGVAKRRPLWLFGRCDPALLQCDCGLREQSAVDRCAGLQGDQGPRQDNSIK